jgi:hypothetical protein
MNSSSFNPKNGPTVYITTTERTAVLSFYMDRGSASFHFSTADARALAERIINTLDNEALDQTKKENDHAEG